MRLKMASFRNSYIVPRQLRAHNIPLQTRHLNVVTIPWFVTMGCSGSVRVTWRGPVVRDSPLLGS